MKQETKNYIENQISQVKQSSELLSTYSQLIKEYDKKVINKNLLDIKTSDAHYRLKIEKNEIEVNICPLNSEGYSYVDYYDQKANFYFDYWKYGQDVNFGVGYIPEGKTKEVFNADKLIEIINTFIENNDKKIKKLEGVNENMVGKYLELYDQYKNIENQLQDFQDIGGVSFRTLLERFDERTPQGELVRKDHTLY